MPMALLGFLQGCVIFVLQVCTSTGSGVRQGPLCLHPPWGAGPWELVPRQD